MIEARELRIGNVVDTPRGTKEIVEIGVRNNNYYATFDGLHKGYYLENCEPIPLTEEILLKCGFVEIYRSDYVLKLEHAKFPEIEWKQTTKPLSGDIFFMGNCIGKTYYLHQLQNLCFALTGEELDVTNILK